MLILHSFCVKNVIQLVKPVSAKQVNALLVIEISTEC